MKKPLSNKVKEQIEELGGKTLFFNNPTPISWMSEETIKAFPEVYEEYLREFGKNSYCSKFAIGNEYMYSVVCHKFSYGHEKGLHEVALLKSNGDLIPLTEKDDVAGWLDEESVVEYFKKALELAQKDKKQSEEERARIHKILQEKQKCKERVREFLKSIGEDYD